VELLRKENNVKEMMVEKVFILFSSVIEHFANPTDGKCEGFRVEKIRDNSGTQ
jgi:hypothetical protein